MIIEEVLRNVLEILINHNYILSFAAGLITEELVLFLAILSGKGGIPFWAVFFFGLLGALCIDTLYFIIARTKFITYLRKIKFVSKSFRKMPKFVRNFGDKNNLGNLIISKFIYGTRMISIMAISIKGIKFGKFFAYDLIALIIWGVILLPLGWLAGRGITLFLHVAKNLEKLFLITLLIIIIYHFGIKNLIPWIFRKIIENSDN